MPMTKIDDPPVVAIFTKVHEPTRDALAAIAAGRQLRRARVYEIALRFAADRCLEFEAYIAAVIKKEGKL